ncbi:hypothetical protein SAMN05444405_102313 [Bacteroides luti]|uniref:Uncharacterized protein n=1 Tax=Bacteroides luti TaxID=1297750 RepID=A0A1M4VKW3_9BACE|nr:hypothetical protein [Bacteroides luti]SHE69671.1 hypothetical protein SAMN05444405_102313 [Bacteroides luti]
MFAKSNNSYDMIYKEPICSNCEHRIYDKPGAYCKAFPDGDGIPDEILVGAKSHFRLFKGQKGSLIYSPQKKILFN